MNEELWLDEVNELLSEKGIEVNMDDDGWSFMFENGFSPARAIAVMLEG